MEDVYTRWPRVFDCDGKARVILSALKPRCRSRGAHTARYDVPEIWVDVTLNHTNLIGYNGLGKVTCGDKHLYSLCIIANRNMRDILVGQ